METLLNRITRVTEAIAAIVLAVIFITFILQVFTRYAAKIAWMMPIPSLSEWMADMEPLRWSVYLISLLWVWVIFFSCAFFVRDRDHVVFDIIYHAMPTGGRKVLAIIGAIILVGIMVYSFVPTYEALWSSRLMELKKLQTLRMPITGDKIAMKWLFVPYLLLMVAVIIRGLWSLYSVLKYGPPKDHQEQMLEELTAAEGVDA